MFVTDNTILSFKDYFFERLNALYEIGEVEQLYILVFFYYKGWNRIELRMNETSMLSESELLELKRIVNRLEKAEPIQHVFSKTEFYDLEFYVDENVLVPRQETEELVAIVLQNNLGKNKTLLDIGTGSGCIPVSISHNNPYIKVLAIDISEKALTIAEQNAKAHQVELTLYCEDVLKLTNLDSIISDSIDIIVSNPPYVTIKEKSLMHKNVIDFDPHLALFVEDNAPLVFYCKIANLAFEKLNKGGELYFEINEYFGIETKKLVEGFGFSKVELIKDLNEKDRIIYAIK